MSEHWASPMDFVAGYDISPMSDGTVDVTKYGPYGRTADRATFSGPNAHAMARCFVDVMMEQAMQLAADVALQQSRARVKDSDADQHQSRAEPTVED